MGSTMSSNFETPPIKIKMIAGMSTNKMKVVIFVNLE